MLYKLSTCCQNVSKRLSDVKILVRMGYGTNPEQHTSEHCGMLVFWPVGKVTRAGSEWILGYLQIHCFQRVT